ncbi:MAG: ribokinase [Victivallales bacterium]|nr:ribokinase [Victivallales bacterium]
MRKVINFGSLNIDHTYRVSHPVQRGETLGCSAYRTGYGGKGANQSIALARAGAPVYHAGYIGKDGIAMRDELRKNKVNVDFIAISDAPTGHAIIQVDDGGDNSILLFPGANHCINAEHIDAVINSARPGDMLLLQNEINNNELIIAKALAAGLEICLNFAPFDNLTAGKLPLASLAFLIVNEIEGAGLTGSDDPERIMDRLCASYPETTIILTLGENGVIGGKNRQRTRIPAVPATAVDTTAAGDTFIGYFLAARLYGKSLRECLEEGNTAAAAAVGRSGAMASIPYRRELKL